jgi:hypothetical protein
MPELSFRVEGAEPVPFAAAPELAIRVEIVNATADERVHGMLLRCQVRIDAPERTYDSSEAEQLVDLFGPRQSWGKTLKSLLWATVSAAVPAFEGRASVDLHLPCSFDFALATTKYFRALRGGDIPLTLLFSGTVFHAAGGADVRATPIAWTGEAHHRLPRGVYEETVAHYFPDGDPLPLRRDVFERLARYRTLGGHATWERAIESLLAASGAS